MPKKYIALGILSSLVLAGCSLTAPAASPDPTPSPTPISMTSPSPAESMIVTGEPNYTIDMKPFAFSIKTITVKPGQTISVKLTNSEGMHDMVIDELGVKSNQLKVGEEQLLSITIPESAAGQTYEYYCSVGDHRSMGMVGKLVVSK